jgi:membrane associated rhomboid family serine protease
MLPLSDGIPTQRFPSVNVALIAANFARVTGLLGIIPVRLSAYFFLGFWFLYLLFEANFGLFGARANGGGVAFFAHVGGFAFGVAVTHALLDSGRVRVRRNGAIRATG